MIKIALCDDTPLCRKQIKGVIYEYQTVRPDVEIKIYSYDSGDKLLESINADERYDIYFLDIMMPNTDGITVAQGIRKKYRDVPVVFLTQTKSYALEAFGVLAFQYLLKPIHRDNLFPVLDRLVILRKNEEGNVFSVFTPSRIITLPYFSIMVIEYYRRALLFHLDSGKTVESKAIRITFGAAVSELLNDSRFIWAHKSFIVNMAHVREFNFRVFIMKNGMEIPIPRNKFTSAKRTYLNFLVEETNTGLVNLNPV